MKVNEELRQRIMNVAGRLFERQLSLAVGQSFLYRIDKQFIATGKGPEKGYWRNKPPVLVEDADEISRYLEGEFEGASEDEGGASYYFITTKEPNGRAIENMLDRALGGAPKALEITNPDGSLKSVIVIKSTNGKNSGGQSTSQTD